MSNQPQLMRLGMTWAGLMALAWLLYAPFAALAERDFPSNKPLVDAAAAQVDRETATLMMKRAEATPSPMLEADIDLRIIERWLLTQASSGKSGSEEQIIAQLRWYQLNRAIAGLDDALKGGPAELSATQKQAASRLHQMSFALAESTEAGKLDMTCRDVGALMLLLSSATPPDAKQLPVMRPPRLVSQRTPEPSNSQGSSTSGFSLTQLTDAARRAAVSQSLRQQLLKLAGDAAESGRDPAHAKETTAMLAVLNEAVEIATGLAQGAVSATSRDAMDAELASGLALYADPRTRAAGQACLSSLNQYRQVLERENHIQLPAEQRAKLTAVFAYAQANMDQSGKVLDLVEKFAAQVARLDAVPKTPLALASLKKPADDVRAQCEQHRDAFLAAAATPSQASAISGGPESMESQLNDLKQEVDLASLLLQIPSAVDLLQNGYKTKPVGTLERKVVAAAVAAASSQRSAARLDAIKTLGDIAHLATIAGPPSDKLASEIPASIAQAYAGGPLDKMVNKHLALVANTAAQVALGQDVDKNTFNRLEAMRELDNGLRLAVRFEAALGTWENMSRWADMQCTADQLRAAIGPFQSLMIAGYAAIGADTSESLDAFSKQHGRYVPLMKLVVMDGAFAADCSALPTGLQGALAQLLTPMEDSHFAVERMVSFGMPILMSIDDTSVDAQIVGEVSRYIREHSHLTVRLDEELPPAKDPTKP